MDAYFNHNCVPSVSREGDETSCKAELVLVQEAKNALGVSRSVTAHCTTLLLCSKRLSKVIVFAFEEPTFYDRLAPAANPGKLTVADFASDLAILRDRIRCPGSTIKLLKAKLAQIAKETKRPKRSIAIVIDSLTSILEDESLDNIMNFFQSCRSDSAIGSLVTRYEMRSTTHTASLALSGIATALMHVETRSSLGSYPVMAKERTREIPEGKDGFILIIRSRKDGRYSEKLEYFKIQDREILLTSEHDMEPDLELSKVKSDTLLVASNDITFDLHISEKEKIAKQNTQLPYQHRSIKVDPRTGDRALFYIDEDDNDWDDDDIDDDLDL